MSKAPASPLSFPFAGLPHRTRSEPVIPPVRARGAPSGKNSRHAGRADRDARALSVGDRTAREGTPPATRNDRGSLLGAGAWEVGRDGEGHRVVRGAARGFRVG